jgi:hypothetical protein
MGFIAKYIGGPDNAMEYRSRTSGRRYRVRTDPVGATLIHGDNQSLIVCTDRVQAMKLIELADARPA